MPDIVGQTAGDAEKLLRAKNLTLGQASPQPIDPKGKIVQPDPGRRRGRQGRHAGQHLLPRPGRRREQEEAEGQGDKDGKGGGGGGGAAAPAAAAAPRTSSSRRSAGAKLDAYAKKAADLGIVPVVVKKFNDAPPGTPFATEPPGGTKVAAKSKLRVLVSVGQPQVVYTNGKNILRLNGATGGKLDPVATSPEDEEDPTWAADGEHVAYTADGRVMLKDLDEEELGRGRR